MQIFNSYSWLVPFLFFIIGYGAARLWLGQAAQPMPNLVGMQAYDAFGILSTRTLNPRIIGYKNDPDVIPGTILSQAPPAGNMVKAHQSIFLVLAQEPVLPIMPQMIQRSYADICVAPSSAGITPTVHYLNHAWPAEICFAQCPSTGHIIGKHVKPILYVSSGTKHRVVWPSFVGLPIDDVMMALTKKGITADILQTAHEPSQKNPHHGYVIDQRPLAGSLVDITKPEMVAVQLRIT
jgi:beta-lactam-binding protein with PASTA domain